MSKSGLVGSLLLLITSNILTLLSLCFHHGAGG